MQSLNKKELILLELQITETRLQKVVRTDGRTDGGPTGGRSGHITRPAFAKTTQVKISLNVSYCDRSGLVEKRAIFKIFSIHLVE